MLARKKQYRTARSLLEESLALYREIGDKEAIAWSLFTWRTLSAYKESTGEDTPCSRRAWRSSGNWGNKRGIADLPQAVGPVALFVPGVIRRPYKPGSRRVWRSTGNWATRSGMAFYFWISGWVAFSQGDTVTAHASIEQSSDALARRWGADGVRSGRSPT